MRLCFNVDHGRPVHGCYVVNTKIILVKSFDEIIYIERRISKCCRFDQKRLVKMSIYLARETNKRDKKISAYQVGGTKTGGIPHQDLLHVRLFCRQY